MDIQKKFLLITCGAISLIGLFLIYLSASKISPPEIKLSEIDEAMIGKLVSTKGKISHLRTHPSGHIFLTLTDGDSKIEVPIFSNLANRLIDNGITQYDLKKGKVVKITGVVGKYKDRLQIVPRKISDIIFLA